MKLKKENKYIAISGILLVLLSVCFTAAIDFTCFYDGSSDTITVYFIGIAVRLAVSMGAFVLARKYGRTVIAECGWVFAVIGTAAALFLDKGYIYFGGYDINISPLVNVLAVLGTAVYFYKYGVKSVLHTAVFWILGFSFLLAAEKGVFVVILTVMIGFMIVSAYKNKIIDKKAVWILNLALYAVLVAWSAKVALTGVIRLRVLFCDTSYMAATARNVFKNIKWFGAGLAPNRIGGAVLDYKLLWIFGLYGIAAGAAAVISLTAFVFFVCKKSLKSTMTDEMPIAYAAASILLVRYIVSMLTNFGIVLDGLFASIPILSDGTCGYTAIFVLIGLLLCGGKDDLCNNLEGDFDNKTNQQLEDR